MSVADTIRSKLRDSMQLYDELAASLTEASLQRKLPDIRSNRVGQQIWCVVGARESYARAVAAGAWEGFRCSMTGPDCESISAVREALLRSREEVEQCLVAQTPWSDVQSGFVLALLEHEAAHQGQLIRYLYALELPIPEGWKSRYALS